MPIIDILNRAVEKKNQIDAAFVFDVTNSFMLRKNTVRTQTGGPILDLLDEVKGHLGKLKDVNQTVDDLGIALQRGKLEYALFQIGKKV